MQVTYYLKRPKSEIATAVYARIYYSGYETKYYVPECSILPTKWNPKDKEARRTLEGYGSFNARLRSVREVIFSAINRYKAENAQKAPAPAALKTILDGVLRESSEKAATFMAFFKDLVMRSENGTRLISRGTRKGKPVTPGTIRNYNTTLACLEGYQQSTGRRVDFDTIDLRFYNDFVRYCTEKLKHTPNYIGKHIKTIKVVLQDAKRNFGIAVNPDFENPAFITIAEDVDNIYLTEKEIKALAALDLTDNKAADRVRDLFLVGCYTGLRYSDLSKVTAAQVNGNMLTLTQVKTSTPIAIPVHDTVRAILAKYGGHMPKALSNQKMNDAIKLVCGQVTELKAEHSTTNTKGGETKTTTVPKHKLVSTHTMRRSFATNEFLAGTPPLLIMAITGHKTEKAFLKYIKVARQDRAEMLGTLWAERRATAEQQELLNAQHK